MIKKSKTYGDEVKAEAVIKTADTLSRMDFSFNHSKTRNQQC